jgi:hypothetical protein
VQNGTLLASRERFPPASAHMTHLFRLHLNPDVMPSWNGLPPRTRGSLERQLNGMAKLVGFRELLSDGERYGSVRTGKVEALYELDTSAKLLRVYEVRRHLP